MTIFWYRLILLVLLITLACTANPTATLEPTPTPTSTSSLSSSSSLALLYDVDETRVFTIKQLGDEYVKLKRGEGTSLTGQPIIIEGCHAKDSVKIGEDLWIAFSSDGNFVLKDNVVLISGFDSLPKVDCYEMVVRYKGLKKISFLDGNVSELQRFRLVDGQAIRPRR